MVGKLDKTLEQIALALWYLGLRDYSNTLTKLMIVLVDNRIGSVKELKQALKGGG